VSNLISANKEELESLQGRITAKNPADEARQLRIRKAGLEKLKGEFAIIGALLNSSAVSALEAARNEASAK